MSDADSITKARAAVEAILRVLGVDRVICVDDTYGDQGSVEEVVAAALGLDAGRLANALPELGESIPDDQDVLRHKVREVWNQLDEHVRPKRADALLVAARQDGDETDDRADASILNELIPEDRFVTLSPSQWEKQGEDFLKADADRRTLFLFDRDLSGDGGDSEGGIKIIASLLARSDSGRLICGLLTHTVAPDDQIEQWDALSKAHGIPRDRFVVIPKLHLRRDPVLFAQTLKFAALCPDFTELKQKTQEIIAEAASSAARRVDEVSIFDLDHIVFQVSAAEGLWEPDMLFRLHALFHRLESRRLAHEGGGLEDIARRLRAVSAIPTECGTFTPPSNAWAIQREELFESDAHINENHLPLEVGDIFKRVGTTSRKRYILLAQPCDLMVRSDGKRQPELGHVPVAEVISSDPIPKYSEELPYYGSTPSERWYVRLKLIHQVRPCILDLCVLNEDGVARLVVGGDSPAGIRPAWKARHAVLSRLIGRAVRKADKLALVAREPAAVAELKTSIASDVMSALFDEGLFEGRIAEADGTRVVTYNCRRVGRVSRARAIGLLMAYTGYLSRPAYDRSFGPSQQTERPR